MQPLNSWHQPHHFQTAVQPPAHPASPQPDLVFQRIQAGLVQYRGGLTPFPVYLTFVRKDALKGSGAPAAVFQVAIGSHRLEAWVVPDSSGMPKIVHAQGGANKVTELTFVDRAQPIAPVVASPRSALYVRANTLATNEFATIGAAIESAAAGDQIIVAAGRYAESFVIDKAVSIIADRVTGEVIVEGPIDDWIVSRAAGASLRGISFQIGVDVQSGDLLLEDCDITSAAHACIRIQGEGTRPTLRRCKIHGGKECGVLVAKKGGGLLEDCDIWGNVYAGVGITSEADPRLHRCKIHDGKQGGVLAWEKGAGVLEECDIWGNAYAGIEIRTEANPRLHRCKIHDGKGGGVFAWEKGAGVLEECDIWSNAYAGIEIKTEANPSLHRCKIHDGKGGGVFAWEKGAGLLEECDIWGNTLAGIEIKTEANPRLNRCKIHDGKGRGVFAWEKGAGLFEECDIWGNVNDILIQTEASPTLLRCKIGDQLIAPVAPPAVAPPAPVAPRVASYAEWARARSAQVSVFVSELGMHMPMGYIGDTTLFNGRPAALYELRLPVRTYRCMVAPSDRNGAPVVVAADRPALKSDFRIL